MAGYNVFNHLPRLVIDADNVSGSFGKWLKKYKLAARLAEINMGTEKDENGDVVPKFRGETKLLALLNSIGNDGIDVLESQGFDLEAQTDEDYVEAIELLQGYYEKKESEHVAWVKAATSSQNCGESELEFLLRVEKLSRNLGFVKGADIEKLRQRFATSMALVGLRDEAVREKLMMDEKLDWKSLSDTLKVRSIAIDSSQILTEARSGSSTTTSSSKVNRVSSDNSSNRDNSSYDNKSYSNDSRSRQRSRSADRVNMNSRGRRRSYSNSRYSNNSRDYSRDRYQNNSSSRYRSNSRDRYRDTHRDRYRNDSRDRYSRTGSPDGRRSSSSDRYRSGESNLSSYRHKSPDYREGYGRRKNSNQDRCYVCHRTGHIAVECPDIRCYACGKRGHTANNCDTNRKRRNSGDNRSPRRYSPSRDNRYHNDNKVDYSNDNSDRSSAVRFNNS